VPSTNATFSLPCTASVLPHWRPHPEEYLISAAQCASDMCFGHIDRPFRRWGLHLPSVYILATTRSYRILQRYVYVMISLRYPYAFATHSLNSVIVLYTPNSYMRHEAVEICSANLLCLTSLRDYAICCGHKKGLSCRWKTSSIPRTCMIVSIAIAIKNDRLTAESNRLPH
jgi:hypothetical protein